jgi:hypothetical protein
MPADADSANALFARVERLGLRALSADAADGLHRSIKLATRELVQFASLSSQISCLLEAGELRVNDFDLGGRVEGDLARDRVTDDFGGIFTRLPSYLQLSSATKSDVIPPLLLCNISCTVC